MLQHYRWLLFNFQAWSFAVDLLATILISPVFYSPIWGGYSHGLFRSMGIPMKAELGIAFFVCPCIITSVIALFEHRHFCVTPSNSWFIVGSIFGLMLIKIPEDQLAAKLITVKESHDR
ncbi:unnamed protein product [Caenorhabditis auriculariae]|uniref:Uncharacterized protein n=1 Tax=Caenorhabditis auriculariae TaxID=2777116 RepID=A0A8S1HCU0_9PELO|nr:unnamed protein product [Caenorhabditis auriculariae]